MCLCVVARGKSGRAGGGGAPAQKRHHETEGVHLKVQRFSGQRTPVDGHTLPAGQR